MRELARALVVSMSFFSDVKNNHYAIQTEERLAALS